MSRRPNGKVKVLVVVGHYLPGFKSGGILRTVENTVNHLCGEFDFYVVTRDHDIGENSPYSNIKKNEWQIVGEAKVRYLSAKECAFGKFCEIINNTPQDLTHLNSFFDPLTVRLLFARRLGKISRAPLILSPRGEFAWASLRIKFLKKLIYILVSKSLSFFDDITWHASSEHEKSDIEKIMKVKPDQIRIARDLPTILKEDVSTVETPPARRVPGSLRVIFLSRISREKNLDYAIKVLSKCRAKIAFDIFGTIGDERYWRKCQRLLDIVPSNLTVSYQGPVEPDHVVRKFSEYDLMFFPTGGENYGHVIAESLLAGTTVLTSRNTPWRDLPDREFGWDVDLDRPDAFVEIIEEMASMTAEQLAGKRRRVAKRIRDTLCDPRNASRNRQLYVSALNDVGLKWP